MMKREQFVKMSAQFHQFARHRGWVEVLVERYADPRKPNLCKLWVVNGIHEFKRQFDCRGFVIGLADEVGGIQPATDEAFRAAWNNVIPSYTPEAKAAAILG